MKHLSTKRIKYFIADEGKAVREYRKLGLPKLAKDEAKHKRFFQGLLKVEKMPRVKHIGFAGLARKVEKYYRVKRGYSAARAKKAGQGVAGKIYKMQRGRK
jgi:hypothetical protein